MLAVGYEVEAVASGEEAEKELVAARADEVLAKSFDIGQIRKAVVRVLEAASG